MHFTNTDSFFCPICVLITGVPLYYRPWFQDKSCLGQHTLQDKSGSILLTSLRTRVVRTTSVCLVLAETSSRDKSGQFRVVGKEVHFQPQVSVFRER